MFAMLDICRRGYTYSRCAFSYCACSYGSRGTAKESVQRCSGAAEVKQSGYALPCRRCIRGPLHALEHPRLLKIRVHIDRALLLANCPDKRAFLSTGPQDVKG